ncbi:hypothetical protein BDN72DRAFT_800249 [Pluteus cervinus]|uniref:Uncharacterized protein n=1 Tax=Pluteus cervinus TaxID=181527 RepID=A0ACD3AKN3_9AGAR|nr:hypothetical protein BDN72DRAFT_800249 [Pluteus cervinus]
MGEFSDQILAVARAFSKRAAAEQGGIISGDNPTVYNANDPLRLWVIQVVLIIGITQLLALILGRIRQPRVISEVIGGVILGPTIMGRIPGFQNAIFPAASIPMLTLTSTIGLLLFLFLVGLEIDTRILSRNARASAAVSVAGLVVPLGLGAALGVGVYREFINPSVNFGFFVLFTAVAIGITAFPVLCRILTELQLLDTTVGVVTLSAGVGNDVVGWILLALTVALVNATNGLTALYVLLASAAYVLFMLYPGRWAFLWLARRTGSIEQGSPTPVMMTVTIITIFASGWFTDIIGVHAIFGGFVAGLIIPKENGFAISLVEKMEDLVSILFLPLYFTLSGLKTNLGLLDNGVTWGYIIIICLVAFTSKFVTCAGAAYYSGFNWRESGAIGSLMSCKGLVELIVLNIGLQANILDPRTFSMFVVHALILTFMTTPLTLAFYPPKYRTRESSQAIDTEASTRPSVSDREVKTRFSFVLDKIEQLPAAMTLSQLLQPSTSSLSLTSTSDLKHEKSAQPSDGPTTINALRLIELTTRTSAVLRSQEADSLLYNDPVVSVFRTFGHLNRLAVTTALDVANFDEFPAAVARHTTRTDSDIVILPWSRGPATIQPGSETAARNPFDGVFHRATAQDQTSSVVYSEFIRKVFMSSPRDVALFVDRGLDVRATAPSEHHLFLPFFGGPDDRLALSFLVQLANNTSVTATVVRIEKAEDITSVSTVDAKTSAAAGNIMTTAGFDTIYGNSNTQTRMASDTADNLLWARYTNASDTRNSNISSALSRITFSTQSTTKPLHTATDIVNEQLGKSHAEKTLIVLAGRSRRMSPESHKNELTLLISETQSQITSSVPKTLGDVGAALVATNAPASLLIIQASAGGAGAE